MGGGDASQGFAVRSGFQQGLWVAFEELVGTLLAAGRRPSSWDSSVLAGCPYWYGTRVQKAL